MKGNRESWYIDWQFYLSHFCRCCSQFERMWERGSSCAVLGSYICNSFYVWVDSSLSPHSLLNCTWCSFYIIFTCSSEFHHDAVGLKWGEGSSCYSSGIIFWQNHSLSVAGCHNGITPFHCFSSEEMCKKELPEGASWFCSAAVYMCFSLFFSTIQ